MLAVEEYEELQVNLELEKDLRKKAESFAQEVGMLLRTGKLPRTPVGKTKLNDMKGNRLQGSYHGRLTPL